MDDAHEPFRGVLYWDSETKSFKEKRKERKIDTHFIITDEIPETESYATDERLKFTSKKKLYEHYKQHGMVVKEPGMNPEHAAPYKADPREIRDEIEKAYMDIKYDRIPMSEEEKQKWKEEQRKEQAYKRRNRL